MYWDHEFVCRPFARFVLRDADPTTNNIGSDYLDDVTSALPCVEQQGKRQALAGAERPPAFELGNLSVCPRVIGAESDGFRPAKGLSDRTLVSTA